VNNQDIYALHPIGIVRSSLKRREDSPRQGFEGAPDAWLEIYQPYLDGMADIRPDMELIVVTWLHLADRDVLKVHPRRKADTALSGVFTTRSPDRPNPIGLHRVRVVAMDDRQRIRVHPIEALDGTPIIDIKPILSGLPDDQ